MTLYQILPEFQPTRQSNSSLAVSLVLIGSIFLLGCALGFALGRYDNPDRPLIAGEQYHEKP